MPNPLNVTAPDNQLARDIVARVEAGEYPSADTNAAIGRFTSNHSIFDSTAEVGVIADMLRRDGFTTEATHWDRLAETLQTLSALDDALEGKKAPGYPVGALGY